MRGLLATRASANVPRGSRLGECCVMQAYGQGANGLGKLEVRGSFYSQRVASQKTRHSLPSRGAEKTCQSSLRLLTWR